jgi:TonB-dependent SusC/RagA subfamily outer membrane receptor
MRTISIILTLLFSGSSLFAQEDFYSKHWSQVYKFEVQYLPKSALEVVDQVYVRAKRDKNATQTIKALLYQSKFALTQQDAELFIINKWKEEIKVSQAPLKNILESVLANIYWEYFRENRWTFYNRSRTEQVVNANDFRTWDAQAMFREIHNHFQRSLQDGVALQAINLSTIDDLLIKAQQSRIYRPTLFDFLSHNAIDFYSANESSLTKFNTDFVLGDPAYFQNIDNISLPTDSLSSTAEAIRNFKTLFDFHQKDKDPTALVYLKLEYFQFLVSHGEFKNEEDLLKSSLRKLQTDWQEHPVSAQIGFELAEILNREGDDLNSDNRFKKRDALSICNEVIEKFGTSDGAAKCMILKDHILHQSLSLRAEEYVPIQSRSRILVEYTNIDSLIFGVYKVTDEFANRFQSTMNDSTRKAEMTSLTNVASWKVKLPNLQDYRQHSTEVVVPPMAAGTYLLVSLITEEQFKSSSIFAFATYRSTDLSLIESSFDNAMRFQVVNRNTGRPLKDVDVHLKSINLSESQIDQHLTTDKDGFVEISRERDKHLTFVATVTNESDRAEFGNYVMYERYGNRADDEDDDVTAKSFLFTDRSIYRPGQTVYFKGILIQKKGETSSVVVGQYVDVYIEDVNGEQVGELRLKTNTYGSFSGEFKLPASGITGEYTIFVDEDAEDTSRFWDNLDDFEFNEHIINVEEYKRPTFEVTFQPVTRAYKVNDSITVTGKALSFSGAKIDKGKISFHVKRAVRYPHWAYWGNRYPSSEEEELVSGEGVTNKEGEFQIKFQATPGDDISKDMLPVFHYEITADITDITGETRSASTTVNVGYHSLTATLTVPPEINRKVPENKLSIAITNLNSQPIASEGVIKIFKTKVPSLPTRERPWAAPDLPMLSQEEFKTFFPHDHYTEKSNNQVPEKGKLMKEIPFNTSASNEINWKMENSWSLGGYIIEAQTKDKDGVSVTDIARFTLVDPNDKSVSDNQVMVIETNRPSYTVGDLAIIKIGSASEDATITIDIDRNYKISKTYVKHFSGNSSEITIPITEEMEGGFNVLATSVQYNEFKHVTKQIPVVKQQEQIEIETLTFKDKMQPGSKETWSFEIKGSDPLKKEAEILASMYDASLDQFKPHQWVFDPIERHYYYSSNRISGSNSFSDRAFVIRNMGTRYYSSPKQYFDDLDWFGFSITNNSYIRESYLQRFYSTGVPFGEPSKVTVLNDKNLRKGVITGTITSAEDGAPLPGVNVMIKGTTIGTATDVKGRYVLSADKGDVVVFSFIGLASAEAKVGNKNVMDVSMEMDVTQLSEVVVTALGVQVEKKSLGSAISIIMTDSTSGDVVMEALAGKVAGVQITGMPGGAARIAIRGASTMDAGADPLYVVDGVIVESTSIDQENLASVQVLKGQAATAIYGSRAANGVIIITTKSGQKKLDEEMAKVNARKNFNETAFFFPHLRTDMNGKVSFTFTTPESLTRWKLQLLAHTQDLLSASKTLQAITQKELMVTPNAPRFLRVDDDIILSTKISNLTNREKTGNVALQLSDAATGKTIDALFKNIVRNQPFKVGAKASSEVSWALKVPAGIEAIQYKIVAKAGNFSDGEQNALPVLSNRMLVTETLPMYVKAGETKIFHLEKLRDLKSTTLQHHQLTLEVTSNPAWYVIQALPYLMEFPHECAEQIFSRYYANALATQVATSSPKIKQVFDQWASSDALISNLEKNQDLKSIIINETPWVREAQSESEQKKRIALLFDLNTMKTQLTNTIDKLEQLQFDNGGFTWFAGGTYANRYITQHVASGFGHLNRLNVIGNEKTVNIQTKAISFLDGEIAKDYNRLLEQANLIRSKAKTSQEGARLYEEFLNKQHVGHDQIHYLYMRSFFPDIKINEQTLHAVEYYQKQSAQYWMNFNLYMKGMVALVQHRLKNTKQAEGIMQSVLENSILSDELGMYWKENVSSWYWYEAPIETQALLIEACAEILPEKGLLPNKTKLQTLDELKVWLLKNKQTSQWKTTKATTEAVYALLMNGTEWLTLDKQIEVSVGKKKVEPGQKPEAGTGYFKTSWKGEEISPNMSEVTLIKNDQGIAWAGMYWQYFEDLDKITGAETPLKLSKKVFIVSRDQNGELLTEVKANSILEVGNLLRIRIELKPDRPMEFLHMKDMRASGLEPVDVLSEYKWQEGLGYYQSVKDASMNFFFDNINPGVYVFEYDLRVSNRGNFSNGITTIQSMYAPEFSSHSEGIRISVK